MDPRDRRVRPWQLADEARVNELRAEVGLGPIRPILELGPELASERRAEIEGDRRWWEQWLVGKRWRDKIA